MRYFAVTLEVTISAPKDPWDGLPAIPRHKATVVFAVYAANEEDALDKVGRKLREEAQCPDSLA